MHVKLTTLAEVVNLECLLRVKFQKVHYILIQIFVLHGLALIKLPLILTHLRVAIYNYLCCTGSRKLQRIEIDFSITNNCTELSNDSKGWQCSKLPIIYRQIIHFAAYPQSQHWS